MAKATKKYRDAVDQYDRKTQYDPKEAVEIIKKIAPAKFDETLEIHIRLGIDPRKSDQNVRGTVVDRKSVV